MKMAAPHIYIDDHFCQEHAVLALLLDGHKGRLSATRLIDLFLLLQFRTLMAYGHLIGDREWMRFDDSGVQLLSLLDPDRARKSPILNECLVVEGEQVVLTPAGRDGLKRDDWDDVRALGGHLSQMLLDEVEQLLLKYRDASDSEVRKAVRQRYRVTTGTWLSWDQIIGQCRHWDDECPSVRAYLVDEALSLRRCFDRLLDLTDDRALVKAGLEASCTVEGGGSNVSL